jgi:methylated-DNA-[protein]-cysteine S-methyltransferase
MTPALTTIDSPIGPLRLTAARGALTALYLPNWDGPVEGDPSRTDPVLDEAVAQLRAYFVGERSTFDLPLAPEGTPFQRTVWDELVRIPFATTISYGELAARIGKPHASRAVGLANGRNPIAIIIPCHRVIGASGKLTGYGGGLPTKAWLLDHEKSRLQPYLIQRPSSRSDGRLP